MGIAILIGVLFIAWGLFWARRILDRPNDDGAAGDAIACVGLVLLGAIILGVTLLVYIAGHVNWWGWT